MNGKGVMMGVLVAMATVSLGVTNGKVDCGTVKSRTVG